MTLSFQLRACPARLRGGAPGVIAVVALAVLLCFPAQLPAQEALAEDLLVTQAPPGQRGGRLVVALRAEPSSLNPAIAGDHPSRTVVGVLNADLVHLNRASQRAEPALARSWTLSPDRRRIRVDLRRGLRFSDGEPLDADDVVFTFQVLLDEAVASPYRGFLVVGGEPVEVRKVGDYAVELVAAAPYASGALLFDSVAILPRHRLQKAYEEGTLAQAWSLGAAPETLAGTGPFRLAAYVPGQRLVLERNPHYWKRDRTGNRLPYLDELVFVFVADESAQTLRFQAGETHLLDRLSADSFALLETSQGHEERVMRDLGPGLAYHFLFFNLNDLGGRDLPAVAARQRWFRSRLFRAAVSRAVDRKGIARVVYQGRATPIISAVSPGNRVWWNRSLVPRERSVAEARQLLEKAGFRWDEKGRLLDDLGTAVELSLLVNAGNRQQNAMAGLLEQDLQELGMLVRLVSLEFRALLARVQKSLDYDACLLGLSADLDPNTAMNVWLSSGSTHLWRLAGEPLPWEQEIDALMEEQLITVDPAGRKALYDRVQVLAAKHFPLIPLVSPNVLVGAKVALANFQPTILDHPTLWNVEELNWRRDAPAPGQKRHPE